MFCLALRVTAQPNVSIPEDQKVYAVKIDFKMEHASANDKNAIVKAVFFLNQGKVYDGNIIELTSSNYTKKAITDSITRIIRVKTSDFSGHYFISSLSGKLITVFNYVDGKPADTGYQYNIKYSFPSYSEQRANSCLN